MRRYYIILTILIFGLLLNTQITDAESNNGNITYTNIISSPSRINLGDSFTVSTEISTDTGIPVLGFVDYNLLHTESIFGPISNGQLQSSIQPQWSVTPFTDTYVQGVKIPIDDLYLTAGGTIFGNELKLRIYESGSLLVEADLGRDKYLEMKNNGYLDFIFQSVATDPGSYQRPDINGILFKAFSTYTINLVDSVGMTYVFDVDNNNTTLNGFAGKFLDNNVIQNYIPQIYLLDGEHFFKENFQGTSSITSPNMTPSETGVQTLYVIYGDTLGLYQMSWDSITIDVVDITPPNIAISSVFAEIGTDSQILATVTDGGSVISGVSVEFYIDKFDTFIPLNTALTDINGIAIITINLDFPEGLYNYRAITTVNSKMGISADTINLSKKITQWWNTSAIGEYSNFGSNIIIDGYLQNTNNMGISNITININKEGIYLDSVITDNNGYFTIIDVDIRSVGTYNGIYQLSYNNPNYNGNNQTLAMIINKGIVDIIFTTQTFNYDTQPIFITGSTKDINGNNIDLNIILQQFDSAWIDIGSGVSSNGIFNISSMNIYGVGSKAMRLVTGETPLFTSSSILFTQIIGKGNATLTRENLSQYIEIEYHGTGDFSTRIINRQGLPIEGIKLDMLVPLDYMQQTYTTAMTGITDINGWVNFYWNPDPWFNNYPYSFDPFSVIISATHDNYSANQLTIDFRIIATELSLSISSTPAKLYSSGIIQIDTLDNWGFAADNNTDITIIIDGATYTRSVINGKIELYHTYINPGNIQISVSYSSGISWPYLDVTSTININVKKASYIINKNEMIVDQGDTIRLDVLIQNHLGDYQSNVTVFTYINDTQISISMSNVTGYINLDYFVDKEPGNYLINYIIAESNNYEMLNITVPITVINIRTSITAIHPIILKYSQILSIDITLETMTSSSIDDKLNISIGSMNFLLSTSSGNLVLNITNLSVGTHIINITYNGNGTLLPSNYISYIEIQTMTSNLTLTIDASDTFYGDFLTFQILLSDEYSYIGYKNINLTIGSYNYIFTTNSSGYIDFNQQILEEGPLDIIISFKEDGYSNSSISKSITISKKVLIGSVVQGEDIVYDEWLSLLINVNSDVESNVSGISVSLYYLNTSSSTYELLYSGVSNSSGMLSYSFLPRDIINLPQTMILLWKLDHPYYISETVPQNININKTNLISSVSVSGSFTYDENILVIIYVTDLKNNTLENMRVSIRLNTSIGIYYSFAYTNISGMVQFSYTNTITGNIDFDVKIIDNVTLRYNTREDNFSIIVNKTNINMLYSYSIINSSIYLDLSTIFNSKTYLGNVALYLLNGSYKIISNSYSTDISNFISGYTRFKVVFIEDEYFNSNEMIIDIVNQSSIIHVDDINMNTTDDINISGYFNISIIDGLTVKLQIFNNTWITISQIDILNSSFNFSPDNIYLNGSYQFRVIFDEVLWYNNSVAYFVINFDLDQMNIDIRSDISEFKYETEQLININVFDEENIQGVNVSIFIFTDRWILLDSELSNYNGNTLLKVTADLPYGQYLIKISMKHPYYRDYSEQRLISITVRTTIEIIDQPQGVYSDGGNITIRLYESAYGNAIINGSINVNIEYSDISELIFSGYTNQTGYLVINLPNNLLPSNYKLTILFDASASLFDFMGSSSNILYYTYVPDTVYIVPNIQYKDQYNVSIQVTIEDESGEITDGDIYWVLLDQESNIASEGTISLSNYTILNFSRGDFDSYLLIINYINPSGKYISDNYQMDLEFNPINTMVFYEHIFNTNYSHSLVIDLEYSINLENTSIIFYDGNGNIVNGLFYNNQLIINTSILEVGSYNFTLTSIDIVDFTFLIITIEKADKPFNAFINNIVFGEELLLFIENPFGDYSLLINGVEYLINDTGILPAGEYRANIIQKHQNYNNYEYIIEFTIYQREVNIKTEYSYEKFNDTHMIINLNISSSDSYGIYDLEYNITIEYNNQYFVFNSSQTQVTLSKSDLYQINITVNNNYSGKYFFIIETKEFDYTEKTNIVNSNDKSKTDNPNNPFTLEIVGLLIIISYTIIDQKFKINYFIKKKLKNKT